jgi:PKD repeat protein
VAVLLLCVLAAISLAHAAEIHPGLVWIRYLGGSGADDAHRLAYDSQGNLWIAGETSDPISWQTGSAKVVHLGPGGGGDAFVARLNGDGELALVVFIGGQGYDGASSLALTADGGVVAVGTTRSADFPTTPGTVQQGLRGQANAFIARLDAGGGLQWATLLGGSAWDTGLAVTAMASGAVVVGGSTGSPDFPAVNPLQTPGLVGQGDGFLAVLSAGGDRLEFSTHLGGSAPDEVRDLAVDDQGNIVAVGATRSLDFPVYRAFQGTFGGYGSFCNGSAFVTKVSWPAAQLVFSTFLGGSQDDEADSLAVDGTGQMSVVGAAGSADFPWTPGVYLAPTGGFNVFATRMLAGGSGLVFSARLPAVGSGGGPGCAVPPYGFRVALDTVGRSWVVGGSSVPGMAPVKPLQVQLTGRSDGFISVLSADGTQLEFSTYLGGSGSDALRDVVVSPGGDVFVAGYTESPDLPVTQGSYHGAGDVFVARISTTASALGAVATGSPVSGLAPLVVSFSGSTSGGTGLYAFDWDFGDGSSHSPLQNPTHTYALGGAYTAMLKVTDSAGATASASVAVSVAHNCSLACTAIVPPVVAVGQAGSFSASATPYDCAGSVAYLWTFGDGQSSTQQSPSHTYATPGPYTWSLQASIGSVSCRQSGTLTVAVAPVAATYVVPAMAHNRGYFGTQWRAEVAVVNLLTSPAAAHLTLVFQCTDCPPLFATATVPAGGSVEWRDILVSLFGQPDAVNVSGALLVYADRPVVVTARSYDQTASGTLGSSYPALMVGDGMTVGQTGVLAGLKRNAAFRTNIGAVNLGGAPCTVVVTLYDSGGAQLGSPQAIDLGAGAWTQLNDVLAGAGVIDLAYATVVVQTPGGRAWEYASVVDNATGDPATVPVVVP